MGPLASSISSLGFAFLSTTILLDKKKQGFFERIVFSVNFVASKLVSHAQFHCKGMQDILSANLFTRTA